MPGRRKRTGRMIIHRNTASCRDEVFEAGRKKRPGVTFTGQAKMGKVKMWERYDGDRATRSPCPSGDLFAGSAQPTGGGRASRRSVLGGGSVEGGCEGPENDPVDHFHRTAGRQAPARSGLFLKSAAAACTVRGYSRPEMEPVAPFQRITGRQAQGILADLPPGVARARRTGRWPVLTEQRAGRPW